jgi:hypothetical protein
MHGIAIHEIVTLNPIPARRKSRSRAGDLSKDAGISTKIDNYFVVTILVYT